MSKATKELAEIVERVEQDERAQKEVNYNLSNVISELTAGNALFGQKLLDAYSKINQLEYDNNVLVNTNSLVEADLALYRSTIQEAVRERDNAIDVVDQLSYLASTAAESLRA